MSASAADISSGLSHPANTQLPREVGLGSFFRASQLEAAGVSRHELPRLLRAGAVERVSRGLYRRTEAELTEHYSLAMACAAVPNSIVCLLTALRVHEIGTQSPPAVWLAIPHKARAPQLPNLKLWIVRFSGAAWTYGIRKVTFEGVPARLTSPARTIVDCFRFERLVGTDVAIEALQDGLRQHKTTIGELARVEGVLPSRRLRTMLELRSI